MKRPSKKATKRKGGERLNNADLNPISVWKIARDTSKYGLAIFMHKTRAYYDTDREYTGKQIDAIRAWVKKAKVKLTLDGDWKPFLRTLGVHI